MGTGRQQVSFLSFDPWYDSRKMEVLVRLIHGGVVAFLLVSQEKNKVAILC